MKNNIFFEKQVYFFARLNTSTIFISSTDGPLLLSTSTDLYINLNSAARFYFYQQYQDVT